MRVEPSTGTCPQCGTPIIDAEQYGGHVTRLDAKPVPDGPYRAYYSTRGYWVAVQVVPDETSDVFRGMRRRLHSCRPADVQMELVAKVQPHPTRIGHSRFGMSDECTCGRQWPCPDAP